MYASSLGCSRVRLAPAIAGLSKTPIETSRKSAFVL